MTQDEIIEMARQAGWKDLRDYDSEMRDDIFMGSTGSLKAFAKLVAEKEREAWRNAAIRVGENLATCGPAGYYDYTSQQWLDWALDATTKMQDDYMNLGACGEREACAKLCDDINAEYEAKDVFSSYAEAIRERGQA